MEVSYWHLAKEAFARATSVVILFCRQTLVFLLWLVCYDGQEDEAYRKLINIREIYDRADTPKDRSKRGVTMQNSSFEVINLSCDSATVDSYSNHPIAKINDHEIRISVMTEPYHWHCHPDSDESFLVLEGGLLIDFDDRTVTLLPGHMITVSRGVRHRTRPIGARSVNLTFERAGALSEMLPSPTQ